ncbi:uncharacterized protein NPIL_315911, partial [Nephila pilipes]
VEEFFEYENMNRENKDYPSKRKNTFAYPTEENMKKNIPSLLPIRGNSNSMKKWNDSVKSTPMRQTVLCTDTRNGFGFKINQKEKKSPEILRV